MLALTCQYLLLEVMTLWELSHHQRRCNCGGTAVSNMLLQQSGMRECCAELAEEHSVLPSVLVYWLRWNQLLKGKVGNVLKWVMFVLWLSDYIHNWFSSSIQLVRSFPCSTWHREPLYRQLKATCFILPPDLRDVPWREQQVIFHIDAVLSDSCKNTRPKVHEKLRAHPSMTKVHLYTHFLKNNWQSLLGTNKTT